MQQLSIPFLHLQSASTITDISLKLDEIRQHPLTYLLWQQPKITPQTSVAVAYNESHIFLKFYVDEPHVKADHKEINTEVYRDSCVEFFVSFGDDAGYYNLEFNCIGTCLGQFGVDKQSRHFVHSEILKNIQTQSCFKTSNFESLYRWELTVVIPNDVFIYHNLQHTTPPQLRLNFYKCGDDLPESHFLAWSKPVSNEPNFHMPQYFGTAYFER
ncbi:MAG: carbohydrate-binding family 9-like protein [Bacteroidota bacterium]